MSCSRGTVARDLKEGTFPFIFARFTVHIGIGYWILGIGYWILDIGYWILEDTGYWILEDTGYRILDTGRYWILDTGKYWILDRYGTHGSFHNCINYIQIQI